MSVTGTPLCTLAQVIASPKYREFKEQKLLNSEGYVHFKSHQFVHSERYQSILNAYMNPPLCTTVGELDGASPESLEQQLDAITNCIASRRPFFTREDLAQLSHWKRLAISLEYVHADCGAEFCWPLNTLIGTCDAFFRGIPSEEWLSCIIGDQEVMDALSDKKIAKLFLQERCREKNEKYCVSMGPPGFLDKIGFFSPKGYYSLRRINFKTATPSNKSLVHKNNGKVTYTGTYVPLWGIKEKLAILTNLSVRTLHDQEYRQYKRKKLDREFHNLKQLSGRGIAVEPYDYFQMTGYKNTSFGFLIEAYEPLGNLYSWLQKPQPKEHKEDLIDSVIQKMHELHALGFMHGDIKDENIVIHFNPQTGKHEVRLIDWEDALPIDACLEEKALPKGTALYFSPEYSRSSLALKQLPAGDSAERERLTQELVSYVAPCSDVWSLGMVLDRICNQEGVIESILIRAQREERKKFSFDEIEAKIAQIDQHQIDIYFVDKVELIDLLIQGMLCVDPQNRLTMQQVKSEWDEIKKAKNR